MHLTPPPPTPTPRATRQDVPLHEVLHREATTISAKKAAMRAAALDAELAECTFAPRLVADQIVPEGRVMRVGRAQGAAGMGRGGG